MNLAEIQSRVARNLLLGLAALAAARALKAEPGRGRAAWVMLGVALGLGLENKLSVLWYGAGLFVGILVSPSRVVLKTRWPWIAGLLALAMLLPYVRWEQANGWPTREFVHNATTLKMASISPWER